MNRKKLGYYILNFVMLNPKKNKYPNFNKYDLSSFLIIQYQFKENKKYIITSNYDDIFYNKNEFLNGKKWIEIILSSKDIFEYHKKIRDDFPFCKSKQLVKILIEDLFFWFDKNTKKIIIDATDSQFNIELRQKLEKIRIFLDEEEWSNYFFNLQKLMHEQIINLLNWESENLNWNNYSKALKIILTNYFNSEIIENYFQKIESINLYRNTLCKAIVGKSEIHKKLFNQWNNFSDIEKKKIAFEFFFNLLDVINTIDLINVKKSI